MTPTLKEDILKHVSTITDWVFEPSTDRLCDSQSSLNKSSREDDTSIRQLSSRYSRESNSSPLSRSACTRTYTNLASGQIRPSRCGTESLSSTSPCHGKRSHFSRDRLDNLPPLRLVVLQACQRMYEDSQELHTMLKGSSDQTDQDVRKLARDVSNALKKEKYDFESFIIATRDALTTLVSEGIMSLQLLALVLERMADVCRLPPLRQDIDGLPSDEKAALMVDRWLRRTAETMLDGTTEDATTMVANKVCRSSNDQRNSRRGRSNRRGLSSKARKTVPVAREGLPITARVHYNDEIDMVHFLQDSFDVENEAVRDKEAPTPARFTHFGESPKTVGSDTPTLIFEQDPDHGAPTPKRWNHFGSVGSVEIFPAALAA